MTAVRRGIDLLFDIGGSLAWALAAFIIASRLFSPAVGGLAGLAVFFSALAIGLGAYLHEGRMGKLAIGVCPECGRGVTFEHNHRRWEAPRTRWLPPLTSWECSACGYAHTESWVCPTCPAKD
jgi:hypothetical protein